MMSINKENKKQIQFSAYKKSNQIHQKLPEFLNPLSVNPWLLFNSVLQIICHYRYRLCSCFINNWTEMIITRMPGNICKIDLKSTNLIAKYDINDIKQILEVSWSFHTRVVRVNTQWNIIIWTVSVSYSSLSYYEMEGSYYYKEIFLLIVKFAQKLIVNS